MTVTLKHVSNAISLHEAAKLIPGRPSCDTLRRWISKGVRGGIKLQAFRSGGQLYTTEAYLEEFLNAQNSVDPTTARRSKSAAAELAELGV